MVAELPPRPVGFVGLGTMGAPMASRLLASGYPLIVHNRERAKAGALLSSGATWAETPRDLGKAVRGGVVLVMVSDARAARAVLFGRRGLVGGAADGTLIVNLSTIGPEESRGLAERLAARRLRYLEAPVGGSQQAAAQGELLLFVGGDESDLATARPYLERLARRIEHLGPVGTGMAMKLVNNLVTLGTVALDAEALTLGEALGLPTGRVLELLLAGGGESAMLRTKQQAFARRDYPVQFKLALAVKDLKLIGTAAREAGTQVRFGREARRLVDEAVRAGLAERDFAAVYETARGRWRTDRPPARPETSQPSVPPAPAGDGAP